MAIKKITYDNKVGVIPKNIHINEVWDDDMNEIKEAINTNADQVTQNTNDISNILGGSVVPDATALVKGKLKLAGDLGGTADLPTVPELVFKANDLDVVHKVGTEDIPGDKTFLGTLIVQAPTLGTHAVTKAYADGLVVGLLDDRGSYNASTNLFPSTGGSGTSGAILKGDLWYVSVAGTLGGRAVVIGDSFRALVDSPAQVAANWSILSSNLGYVPANDANVIHTTLDEGKNGKLTVTSNTSTPTLIGNNTSTGFGVQGSAGSGVGVAGSSTSSAGVSGSSSSGIGVLAASATGIGSRVNNSSGNTSDLAQFGIAGSIITKVDYLGNVTGNSFIKQGGSATQFLKANGSVDSTTYADDSDVVHKTGNETAGGQKTFSNTTFMDSGMLIKTTGAIPFVAGYNGFNGMASGFSFHRGTDGFLSRFNFSNTAIRDINFPDKSGTVAMTSDIPASIITGTGTANKLSKWTSSTVQGDSMYTDNGLDTGINTTSLYTLGAGWSFLNINNTTGSGFVTQVNNVGALRISSNSTSSSLVEVRNLPITVNPNGNESVRFLANGNVGIGTTSAVGKLDIFTGLTGDTTNLASLANGTISFANASTPNTVPIIIGKSNTSIGLSFQAGTNDSNAFPDMQFNVRENDNTDFTTLTTSAFRFSRFSTTLVDILRNGNVGINVAAPAAKLDIFGAQGTRIINVATDLTPDSGVTMGQGIALAQVTIGGGSGYAVAGYQVNSTSSTGIVSQVALNADTGTIPLITLQGNQLNNAGSGATIVANRPILGINNYTSRIVTVLANGAVGFGIGLATPNYNLHVHAASATNYIQLTTGNTGTAALDGSSIGVSSANDFQIVNRENSPISFWTNTTEKLRVHASGGVSVGNTVDPGVSNLSVTGNVTAANLVSGTYTPTLSNTTNVTGAAIITATYMRLGDIVTVYLNISATVTTASILTVVSGTLPFNRISTASDLVGTAIGAASGYTNIHNVRFQMANNTTQFTFSAIPPASGFYNFNGSFSYKIT